MRKRKSTPKWAWKYFQAVQDKASAFPDEPNEEKLNFVGRLIIEGKTPATLSKLKKMVDNYLAGHRQKRRRHKELLERYSSQVNDGAGDQLASRDALDAVQQHMTPIQWQILSGIGCGFGYEELSSQLGTPAGTLKSTVYRVRDSLDEIALELKAG